MKKKIMQLTAILIAIAMLTAIISGCKKEPEGYVLELPEFVYVPETVTIPSDLGDVYSNNIALSGDKVYFAANVNTYDEETYVSESVIRFYSMNIDGTDITELPNYKPPLAHFDGASGWQSISSISVDGEGGLWVNETWNAYSYELPDDFDSETDQVWNYYTDHGSGNSLRKLDSTGAEVLTLDIEGLANDEMGFNISSINLDNDGNLYLNIYRYTSGGTAVLVLDSGGSKLFEIEITGWLDRLIKLQDGRIAYRSDTIDAAGNFSYILQTIDLSAKGLGDTITVPNMAYNVYTGNAEYDLFINDSSNLYGFNIGEEEPVKVVNWIDSDMAADNIQHIDILSDGRIALINTVYNQINYSQTIEISVLTKTPYSELPEKTVLSLATVNIWNIRNAVVHFNRENPNYRIQVVDYSEFSTEDDWSAGVTRLNTEIISGKAPDLLDLNSLPTDQYIAKGLLLDLYPLLDADPNIGRGDIVEGVLRAAETNGALYRLFPSFILDTIIGHPSIVGAGMGWTMDEFMATLAAHPEADMPLGQWLNKMSILQTMLQFHMDDYIDWNAGTTNFNSERFIQLLELANTFPAEPPDYSAVTYVSEDELYSTGRQIMSQVNIGDFWEMRRYNSMFNDEFIYKGYPTESRNGNSLRAYPNIAITSASKNVDGAWEFMRLFLNKDYQLSSNNWGFPTNKAVFDEMVEQAFESSAGQGEQTVVQTSSDGTTIEYVLKPLTQEHVDDLLAAVASTNGISSWSTDDSLYNIISEGASDYFNGASSAQDAARIIQSRVSILVSERN